MPPTRTVMILGFESPEELMEYRTAAFDPELMAEFYTVPKNNLLFFIFYDLRDSVKFTENFRNPRIKAFYTISKYEIPRKGEECTEKSLQSTICFIFNNLDVSIEDDFVISFLSQYGNIRNLKDSEVAQKTIEFYSIKDARKAFSSLNGTSFGTGEIKCSWSWDIALKERIEYIRLTDAFIKKGFTCETSPVKRPKIDIPADGDKNILLKLFDQFIARNINEIEKKVKEIL